MKALILIDIQQGFDQLEYWGQRNNPDAEQKASALLAAFRNKNWPIYHIQHCSVNPESPLRPGQAGNDLQAVVAPQKNEPVYTKQVNSAFIGTPLEQTLKNKGQMDLVIAGLTTDHCVSTSVRMAANLGFKVCLIEDATATFEKTDSKGRHFNAELIHDTALASLDGEFAEIQSTAAFLKDL